MYSDFFADYKNAILSLIKGEFWLEAYQLAIFKHRPDDVDQCIKPELISASTNFIEHLNEIRVEIVKYSDRLKTIWSQKLLMNNSTDDTGQDVEFNDTQSMVSDAIFLNFWNSFGFEKRALGIHFKIKLSKYE